MKTETTELQRIAKIFDLKPDDECLVLKIGDIIKAQNKKYKKKEFCNILLKEQVKKYEKQIHNLHNEFAENIGIDEYMRLKNSHDTLKKNYQKALEDNHNLRSSIEMYRENELMDKLKRIVNE